VGAFSSPPKQYPADWNICNRKEQVSTRHLQETLRRSPDPSRWRRGFFGMHQLLQRQRKVLLEGGTAEILSDDRVSELEASSDSHEARRICDVQTLIQGRLK
jgi:hypothetical protein